MIQDSATSGRDIQFVTVTVNRQGKVIHSETRHAERFIEVLGGAMLEMVAIPGGSFQMGSRASEGYPDEHPQHSVRVQPFWMARFPITQGQWQAVIGSLPRCRTM